MEFILEKLSGLTWKKKSGSSLREKAVKGLVGFLILMVVFTMLSRAADSLTIAIVNTDTGQKRTIDRTIKSNGVFSQKKEEAVIIPEGIRILSVNVNKGSTIEAGDELMKLDLTHLKEQILEIENEIKELELNNKAKKENAELAANTQKKELEQAKEDYNRAVESGNKTVTKAYEAMMEAYQKWQDFKNSRGNTTDSENQVENALLSAYNQKQAAVNEAQQADSELLTELAQAIAEAQDKEQNQSKEKLSNTRLKEIKEQVEKDFSSKLQAAQNTISLAENEVDTAKSAYEQYLAEQKQITEESLNEQEASLETAYNEKKGVYDSAVDSMDETLYTKKQGVENAVKEKEADYSSEISQMNKEKLELKLSKLKTFEETGGVVTAPIDGVVTEIAALTGEFTPSAKSFLISDLSGGFKFIAQINEDQKAYISLGDTVTLKFSGEKRIENLTVEALTPNTEDSAQTDVLVSVNKDVDYFSEIYIGYPAEMEIERKSEAYPATIPLEALHEEDGQKYLLVLKETKVVLGSQLSVERLDVTVLEKNASYAALAEGELASGQKFVIDSNKEIEAGDRVRLIEE